VSNYVKSSNFALKDGLASGDPGKIVKGTEIDTEFNNIATAIGTKADTNSPTFTGVPLAPTAVAGNSTAQLATTAFTSNAVSSAITSERTANATITNKTISVDSNTVSGVASSSFVLSNSSGNLDGAAPQKAIPSGTVVGTTDSQTLTNKTIALGSNTVSGTKSQFNTAVSDTTFAFTNDFTGTNQNLTSNGFQKLPGGVTLLWGTFTSTSDGNQRISFHTPFPTTCFMATTLYRNDSTTIDLDRFGFTFNRNDGIGSSPTLQYFAIGY
jgi:hypothetical protein